ncbi:NAD(P)-dependent dehydrogenase (short-subunit alcohol dehydrogenase family) [Microbacterium endophyticum]|uniref:NAD(P)-dependent dehydrogenase (Short-subunit alcohol dehydrogenase family) n=1 Tax=Microbacterium endophyticum TaxID=1526412 RepID=A0A7W4V4K0_9MICO|nr:SDR family NAD(P)-dependent oxidoreductase [Microbacterium endophyticum]MBB2976175.1 NAD(P)-dependent dehydrogenase (short-subunit alcohol dehydrogenase family) [Microbacterium endophyticum]NIK36472.1 NAD(P)-dependent dehydrogenase (short-subunit alcohol dehydrogenase family) [Microbacterium endophyticum]
MKKTIIITGASDGIGAAAARQLSEAGHTVAVVGRSAEKTRRVAESINADYFLADFTNLRQVRELAEALSSRYAEIDVLANNAGGIMGDRELTVDGFEKTFQVNHLAPFLLTQLLMERLTESKASVINTSSVANSLFGRIDLDNLNGERSYSATRAYGAAKLENVLFTKELHRRYESQGISTVAFHPGNIASNFTSEANSLIKLVYRWPLRNILLTSPETGGKVLSWFVEGTPGTTWISGEYYDKISHAAPNKQAGDAELAESLWNRSAEYVTTK